MKTHTLILFLLNSLVICAHAQIISAFAGNGILGYSGNGGQATAAELGQPALMCFDTSGNMYIADNAYWVVRKVTKNGIISTVIG